MIIIYKLIDPMDRHCVMCIQHIFKYRTTCKSCNMHLYMTRVFSQNEALRSCPVLT